MGACFPPKLACFPVNGHSSAVLAKLFELQALPVGRTCGHGRVPAPAFAALEGHLFHHAIASLICSRLARITRFDQPVSPSRGAFLTSPGPGGGRFSPSVQNTPLPAQFPLSLGPHSLVGRLPARLSNTGPKIPGSWPATLRSALGLAPDLGSSSRRFRR